MEDKTNKEIISCTNPRCRQRLRIPMSEKRLRITCPKCHNIFLYLPSVQTTVLQAESCAYLDIETTSLNQYNGELTVIGLYFERSNEHKVIQLVGDEISSPKVVEIMKEVKVLYTYNGTRFDLPYIKAKLGVDLTKYCSHKDFAENLL